MAQNEERTAVAVQELRQARAAGRRSVPLAAQREAPEAPPAAVERAEQGCAVLCVGGADGLPAAVRRRRVRWDQQPPGGRPLYSVAVNLMSCHMCSAALWPSLNHDMRVFAAMWGSFSCSWALVMVQLRGFLRSPGRSPAMQRLRRLQPER